jgi:hypothetical protein
VLLLINRNLSAWDQLPLKSIALVLGVFCNESYPSHELSIFNRLSSSVNTMYIRFKLELHSITAYIERLNDRTEDFYASDYFTKVREAARNIAGYSFDMHEGNSSLLTANERQCILLRRAVDRLPLCHRDRMSHLQCVYTFDLICKKVLRDSLYENNIACEPSFIQKILELLQFWK